MSRADVDVLIVGGGMAGASLACALADLPLQVVVLEANPLVAVKDFCREPATVVDFDIRVSALTEASRQFFARLGVWPDIQRWGTCAYTDMRVWDAEGTGEVHFSARDIHCAELGHIVENRHILAALEARMEAQANVSVLRGQRLDSIAADSGDKGSEPYRVSLDNGQQLSCHLLVAADGALSRVREQLNFMTREWDYGHKAIAATVQTRDTHQFTAWQRFLPEGPLAMLPLRSERDGPHFCSIVWSSIPACADELTDCDDQEFCAALGQAFEWRLGPVEAVSRRVCFPLRQRHALDYVRPGVALVGDAAHTIHPLAGQGINLGLADVQVLAEELRRGLGRGLQPGNIDVLRRYQRRRKAANLTMMAAMEGFKQLFAQRNLPLRWLRNTGMSLFDRSPAIKHRIMKQAMGL